MEYLAIDIGGTSIKYAIINGDYAIIKSWISPSEYMGNISLVDYIISNIPKDICVSGIGISVPGIVDPNGLIMSKSAHTLSDLYMTNIIQKFTDKYHLPVSVINDANAAGIYECEFGYAKLNKLCICFIIGTGIGGCICYNGKIIYGKNMAAGEFHLIPYYDNKSQKLRCLGDLCKIKSLQKNYQKITGNFCSSIEIMNKYKQGNFAAQQAVKEWCNNIAYALLIITAIYNPNVICIGGAISADQDFVNTLAFFYYKQAKAYFENHSSIVAKLVPCSAFEKNNLLGAVVHLRSSQIAG